jgi:hypothetical protein
VRGGDRAARFDPALRRALGIGNATGLGMAPFLVNHPDLLNNWIAAREAAIARVRALPLAPLAERDVFAAALATAQEATLGWHSNDPVQSAAWDGLRGDLVRLADHVAGGASGWGAPVGRADPLERGGAVAGRAGDLRRADPGTPWRPGRRPGRDHGRRRAERLPHRRAYAAVGGDAAA